MAALIHNPKNSMKSTWRHWFIELLNMHHKVDKFHRWVLIHASIPLFLHQLYISYFGRNPSPLSVFIFYSLAFQLISIHEIHVLRRVGHKVGFFDGDKHARDGVPDAGVSKTVQSLVSIVILRPMMMVFLSYRSDKGPSSLRTHHPTKHPNPLLSGYADLLQEFFDMVGAPLITYGTMKLMGIPFGFYEWWICQQYVAFTEILGHSGLRMLATAVNLWTWLLRYCDVEGVIEDHDLHHRRDCLFHTSLPRVEGHRYNIDYLNPVKIPLL
ncbi:hypothetical protein BGW36DRAFT_401717 [Talaromyces proteolyticus]|uniref:Fatty acid hydroxylase domain-containing protein n=1 Tax=Talaromyces proteolyticus TaxID=1131652 RepID=A0AAD4KIT4_9EURO|nr:uncharacterized protein BGW36DRAFT_401717 [Talaromyces proteolyticus]KAH8689318.1 hypothetical protein BGW36DRAFT_401717 [Talaromyces proteolyticus]